LFEEFCDAQALLGLGDLGAGGEDAAGRIDDDLFHGFQFGRVFAAATCAGSGWCFGKIAAGDLEAVEEETGSAWIEIVGGDALKDFSDGGLDGGTVFGHREVEGSAAATALIGIDDGFAGSVVVVAEVFSA
jgi:hypothetical protein